MSPSFVYISALELQKIDKHKKHEIDIWHLEILCYVN
mgnify:CR=1 FL=1